MIDKWLKDKKIKPCKYCGSENIGFYLKQSGKLERYGATCFDCGRGLGWLPNTMMKYIINEGFEIIHERDRINIRNKGLV